MIRRRRGFLQNILSKFQDLSNRGDELFCPICARGFKRFHSGGVIPRPNAMCPACGSLERHRLLWAALDKLWQGDELCQQGKMLHVAPEAALEPKFREFFEYISIDLNDHQAMVAMDLTALDFPDAHFDAIVCNHVLEHIRCDRKALAEIYRVLKPGGWASIQVPIKGEITLEDPRITDPLERIRNFGQDDHVRQYGWDYTQRLEKVGFEILTLRKADLFTPTELEKLSVDCESAVILALKK